MVHLNQGEEIYRKTDNENVTKSTNLAINFVDDSVCCGPISVANESTPARASPGISHEEVVGNLAKTLEETKDL